MKPEATATLPTPATVEAPPPRPRAVPGRAAVKRDAPKPLEWKDGHELFPDVYRYPSEDDFLRGRQGAYFAVGHGRIWRLAWRESTQHWFLAYQDHKRGAQVNHEVEWTGGWIGAMHLDWAKAGFERARAMGGDIDDALECVRNEGDRFDAVSALTTAFAPKGERVCPKGPLHASFARSFRNFAQHMLRMGWALNEQGEVVETWRDKCRGRWVDGHTIFPHVNRRETHLVRVEGEHLIEIYSSGDGFYVEIDDKTIAEVDDAEIGKDIALSQLRRKRAAS